MNKDDCYSCKTSIFKQMKKIKVWAASKLPAAIQKLSEVLRTFWQVGINLNNLLLMADKKKTIKMG